MSSRYLSSKARDSLSPTMHISLGVRLPLLPDVVYIPRRLDLFSRIRCHSKYFATAANNSELLYDPPEAPKNLYTLDIVV
jgi:hypothetical protein